jgi:hypothetical protein
MSCDKILYSKFKTHLLIEFWIQRSGEYQNLQTEQYISEEICYDVLFERSSSLVALKSKHRSRMDAESVLRLALINTISKKYV